MSFYRVFIWYLLASLNSISHMLFIGIIISKKMHFEREKKNTQQKNIRKCKINNVVNKFLKFIPPLEFDS